MGMARVFANYFTIIFKDSGVPIFFIILPLVYPLIYTLIYNKEVVQDIPIAVVDNSRTAASRHIVQTAAASPAIKIYDYAVDMSEAKRLIAEGRVYGIMEIPSDYSKDIGAGTTAHVTFYSDMSLLMRYRAFTAAMTEIQMKVDTEITMQRLSSLGASSYMSGSALPVASESNFLGNVQQGFASFVIPGIVILVLQQSMLLGIGMLEGTARERRRRNGGIDPLDVQNVPVMAVVWGKALCCFVLYIALAIYNVRIVPWMFDLPMYGDPVHYMLFLVPFLLSVAFMGQSLAPLMRERESPFLVLVVTSVIFLFLSGLTWPRFATCSLLRAIGNILPSTWGINGFVCINNNGATLSQVSTSYIWLWCLTLLYMAIACIVTYRTRRHAANGSQEP